MKDLGVVIGRFQPLHLGHQALIDAALQRCRRVLVLIGSSQESGTLRNPFSFGFRQELLRKVYDDRIMVQPLPDAGLGNNPLWGAYILDNVKQLCKKEPDVMVFGNDGICEKWFDSDTSARIEQVVIKRQEKPISATMVRQALLDNNKELWKEYTDPALHEYYELENYLMHKIAGA